ncbi:MAG: O-antigen ligase family protein [Gordonibacter sp.]
MTSLYRDTTSNRRGIFESAPLTAVLLLPFFKPVCFQYIPALQVFDSLYIAAKILVACIAFSLVALWLVREKIEMFYLAIALFEIMILIITFSKDGAITRAIIDGVSVLSCASLVALYAKYNGNTLIDCLYRIMAALMVAQLISEIVFPHGLPAPLYKNNDLNPLFFFTIDNGITAPLVFFLSLTLLKNGPGKLKPSLPAFAIAMATALFSQSSTAIICCALYLAAIFVVSKFNPRFTRSIGFWSVLYGCCLVLLVVAKKSTFLNDIAYALLGKTLSFTGRDFLWTSALEMIGKSPLIGFGRTEIDYLDVWWGHFSSHNYLLETLLQGGIVSLLCLVFIIFLAISGVRHLDNKQLGQTLLMALFFLLTAMLMESAIHTTYLFCLLALAHEAYDLEKNSWWSSNDKDVEADARQEPTKYVCSGCMHRTATEGSDT